MGVILAESVKIAEAIIEMTKARDKTFSYRNSFRKQRQGHSGVCGRSCCCGNQASRTRPGVSQQCTSGGKTERLDETCETAVRCTQILGLRVAGVDMLESNDGPQVMEVNSSPGLEEIESCTQLDIAAAIVDYIGTNRFPEVDVRQRLSVSRGYGVTEIHIPEGSEFTGQTIDESDPGTGHQCVDFIGGPRLSRTQD